MGWAGMFPGTAHHKFKDVLVSTNCCGSKPLFHQPQSKDHLIWCNLVEKFPFRSCGKLRYDWNNQVGLPGVGGGRLLTRILQYAEFVPKKLPSKKSTVDKLYNLICCTGQQGYITQGLPDNQSTDCQQEQS